MRVNIQAKLGEPTIRIRAYISVCALLAIPAVRATTPMLPHDVVNGCFQLKPASIEFPADGLRGMEALIKLISPNPARVMAAKVTLVRPWPPAGSSQQLFLSDTDYGGFITTKLDSDGRTEGRVYTAAKASTLAASVLPKDLATIRGIAFSEMRSSDAPKCGMEVIVLAALNDPPGPYYSFECDADGCRKVKEM